MNTASTVSVILGGLLMGFAVGQLGAGDLAAGAGMVGFMLFVGGMTYSVYKPVQRIEAYIDKIDPLYDKGDESGGHGL